MVVMGRILDPYGVQGWLKVQPDTEVLDGLSDYTDWWLGRIDELNKSPWQKYHVETVKVHVNILLAKLQGIDDRDAAQAIKGRQIAVPREQLPTLGNDEYYWVDLIGLKVKNQQQIDLGEIIEVLATGANDVLVVKQTENKQAERERLIPYIGQVVLEVDLNAKTMLVDWDAEF